MPPAALYACRVTHVRLRPARHALSYNVCYALFDLDALDQIGADSRWFSYNKTNLFSFFDADHGAARGGLRRHIEELLRTAGIETDGGTIRLLALPRILGYVFNPLSLFFCHGRDGDLKGIVYEVRNTYGERHCYVVPADGDGPVLRHSAPKRFHVSPFIDMAATYRFELAPPAERLLLRIREDDRDGVLLIATLTGHRLPFDDLRLLWVFLWYPLLTLKVIAAIHWEALLLWLKRVRVMPKPLDPPPLFTLGQSDGA